jgi:hypothetical protein
MCKAAIVEVMLSLHTSFFNAADTCHRVTVCNRPTTRLFVLYCTYHPEIDTESMLDSPITRPHFSWPLLALPIDTPHIGCSCSSSLPASPATREPICVWQRNQYEPNKVASDHYGMIGKACIGVLILYKLQKDWTPLW